MKIFKFTLITVFFSFLTYSCSSDDTSSGGGETELADQQNALEEDIIAVSTLESGIEIAGAIKNSGTPPQPNSDINLNVATSEFGAIQNTGFNLTFSTTETEVAGAYLQFTDTGNTAASSYFDIPVSSFNQARRTKVKSTTRSSFVKNNASLIDGDYQIDIDFDDTFPPGKFCGILCIYDSQNNISQPITICIEVEAWGGNASLLGTWIESDVSEDNDTTQVTCNNDSQINVPYDEIINEEVIATFSSNGSFEVNINEEYKMLDYLATAESCSAIYSDQITKDNHKEIGKWAYNEDDNTLSIVAFSFIDLLNPDESEEFPEGELLLQSAKVQLNGNTLVLTETYTEEGETFTEIITLTRK
ncbi:hypothetical protein [uncultured Algibacter sp.]|uniref:hypothetical protein n=1 Tax=uncultured Algibacter sp. TaxID=298659 RepID=UPI00262EBA7A|nr:hypothetical protein [uncultured Algibacter sp.]